jgi:hypothetical protein
MSIIFFWIGGVPPSLPHNEEIALAVLRQQSWAIQYASERLRQSREFALRAVLDPTCRHGLGYFFELQGDRDLILQAVAANGLVIRHATPELRDDEEVARVARQQLFQPS